MQEQCISFNEQDHSFYEGYEDRTQGHTHLLRVVLSSVDALKGYGPSKAHVSTKSRLIDPNVTGILAIDYKDTSPADVKKVTGQDFVKAI